MSKFWQSKKVLVTGGAGFVGSHVAEMLVEQGAKVSVVDNLENGTMENLGHVRKNIRFTKGDLRRLDTCLKVTKGQDIVLNIAARVGGIAYNNAHPGTMFRDNILTNTHVLEAARINKVARFLAVSSACVYPRLCKIPTPETEGFVGVPEPTNEGYGWAKRMAEVQAVTYAREFGMKIAIVRPYNAYGPRDHFDPYRAHVIPALIQRVFNGENPITVWGDGEQSRAFLYVTDLAKGMLESTEKYPEADAINIGTTEEIKIKDLVKLIVELSGRDVDIFFDTTKPSGQPRRNCDNQKAVEKVGVVAKVRLKEGLRNTIQWYQDTLLKCSR